MLIFCLCCCFDIIDNGEEYEDDAAAAAADDDDGEEVEEDERFDKIDDVICRCLVAVIVDVFVVYLSPINNF